MSSIKTKRLTTNGILIALCAVLGYLSLDFGNIKLTFESFPVLLGALLYGPIDGLLIGGLGTLLYQLLRYGVTVTTLLWILPYVLCGLVVGLYTKRHSFSPNAKQVMMIVIVSELLITILNTGSLFVDSHVYGYYSPAFLLGPLPIRIIICIVKATAYGVLLPKLTGAIRKSLKLKIA